MAWNLSHWVNSCTESKVFMAYILKLACFRCQCRKGTIQWRRKVLLFYKQAKVNKLVATIFMSIFAPGDKLVLSMVLFLIGETLLISHLGGSIDLAQVAFHIIWIYGVGISIQYVLRSAPMLSQWGTSCGIVHIIPKPCTTALLLICSLYRVFSWHYNLSIPLDNQVVYCLCLIGAKVVYCLGLLACQNLCFNHSTQGCW